MSEPVERPGRPRRRRDIQGLRALSVVAVIAYHAGLPVPRGYLGVDVFFVISGFVITGTLIPGLAASGRVGILAFYQRRAKRLLPALALMVAVVSLLGVLLAPANGGDELSRTGLFAALFSANIHLYHVSTDYFATATQANPLLHTWSLGVEEQFYLVFPLVLVLGWRLGAGAGLQRRHRTLAGLIGVMTLGSLALAEVLVTGHAVLGFAPAAPDSFVFYNLPTRAWELGAGALLCLVPPRRIVGAARAAVALRWLGLAVIVAGLLTGEASSRPALVPIAAALLVIAAGTVHDDDVVLGHRVSVALGDRSYGWYLWHLPCIVFATALWSDARLVTVAAAGVALALAAASYRWVEQPVRRTPSLTGLRVPAMAALCVGIAASAALTERPLADRVFAGALGDAVSRPHADLRRGCNSPTPLGPGRPRACVWAHPGDRASMVLIGDSNAGHFTEAVVGAAARQHVRLTVATLSSCPFAALVYRVKGWSPKRSNQCRAFVAGSLHELERTRPQLVVMAALSTGYVEDPTVAIRPLAGGPFATTPQTKAVVWRDALAAVLRRLAARGIRVILVHQVPELPAWGAVDCANIRLLLHTCPNISVTRTRERADLRRSVDAERAAVASAPPAMGVSLESALCGPERCYRADADGRWLYSDPKHLSVRGSQRLTGRFSAVIGRALAPPR